MPQPRKRLGYHLGWIVASHVCRRWRAVALITHKFWADALSEEKFDFDDSLPADQRYTLLHYVSTMFARSSPRILQLHCYHFPDNALLYALMAHASKVVSLDVTIFNTRELVTLYSALSSGFLSLEYLKVEFRPQPRREDAAPHHVRRLWLTLNCPLYEASHSRFRSACSAWPTQHW